MAKDLCRNVLAGIYIHLSFFFLNTVMEIRLSFEVPILKQAARQKYSCSRNLLSVLLTFREISCSANGVDEIYLMLGYCFK